MTTAEEAQRALLAHGRLPVIDDPARSGEGFLLPQRALCINCATEWFLARLTKPTEMW